MAEPRHADEVLADLARHPGWKILQERVLDYQEQEAVALGRALLRAPAKDGSDIDRLKLARARGFWAGQRWMLRHANAELAAYQRQSDKAEKATITTG